ncbi:hypothetical protein HOD08_03915 [bacterium]|nr:hypothetical protein [bacterium]
MKKAVVCLMLSCMSVCTYSVNHFASELLEVEEADTADIEKDNFRRIADLCLPELSGIPDDKIGEKTFVAFMRDSCSSAPREKILVGLFVLSFIVVRKIRGDEVCFVGDASSPIMKMWNQVQHFSQTITKGCALQFARDFLTAALKEFSPAPEDFLDSENPEPANLGGGCELFDRSDPKDEPEQEMVDLSLHRKKYREVLKNYADSINISGLDLQCLREFFWGALHCEMCILLGGLPRGFAVECFLVAIEGRDIPEA